MEVLRETKFTCSAGIAHNKVNFASMHSGDHDLVFYDLILETLGLGSTTILVHSSCLFRASILVLTFKINVKSL